MNAMAPSGPGLAAPASSAGFIRHMSGPCLALKAMADWYGIETARVTIERTHDPRQSDRHADEVLWPLRARGIRQRYRLRGVLMAEIDIWYAPTRFPQRIEPLISDPHCVLETAIADVHPARRLIGFSGSCVKLERNETSTTRVDAVETPQITTLLTIFGLPAAVCCELYPLEGRNPPISFRDAESAAECLPGETVNGLKYRVASEHGEQNV